MGSKLKWHAKETEVDFKTVQILIDYHTIKAYSSSSLPKIYKFNLILRRIAKNFFMETIRIPEIVPSPSQDCERLSKAFQGLYVFLISFFFFPVCKIVDQIL